ncbi:STM4504/CBY_0614 family protein [Sessilibacter corallicola]|uniref:Abortive infection protein-like C-terminal domain-containing protein n=1 Tax=Sessilibacter corallicola TaxID=2904075 RepID=A0ABQ0ACM8_9GAMM
MLFDLFSKRRKRERGDFPDVYQYEDIPNPLRVQVVHMLQEAFAREGKWFSHEATNTIEEINKALCREYGIFKLAGKYDEGFEELANFILHCEDYERVLDAIEVSFRFIDRSIRKNPYYYNREMKVESLISELNQRCKEAGIGYQYESGELIRVDSQYLHSEAVKPVLSLLKAKAYHAVNEEFLSAHEHYRHGKYEESTIDCLKALESLLKIICTNRGWAYDTKDTAKKLIGIVLSNGLIPSFMQNQLNVMQTLLESGVPTVRNKLAGHGQGPTSRTMPDYVASYTLHLTASTLLLLANADVSSP